MHGTQKPVECMRRPMLNNSAPGQPVYDPFLGSGTSVIAAETCGRICLGLELDPAYVDVVLSRWEGFTGGWARLDGEGLTLAEARATTDSPGVSPCADASRSRPSLKIIQGNPGRRPLRGQEPQPPRSQPPAPRICRRRRRRNGNGWRRASTRSGCLTQVDRAALAAYCQSYGRWVEAERKLAETPDAVEDARRLRPALALARDLQQAARADGEVHGRARAHAFVPQPTRDPDPDRSEAMGDGVRRGGSRGGGLQLTERHALDV